MTNPRDGLLLTTLDFLNVKVTPAQVAAMRQVVTANAKDAADEAFLLSALGIGGVS